MNLLIRNGRLEKFKDKILELSENEPVGILLCASKNDTMVEMTLGDNKNIYTAAYLTYLPTKEELITVIEDEKERFDNIKRSRENIEEEIWIRKQSTKNQL